MRRFLHLIDVRRFGRRGAFLLLFGFAWGLIGYGRLATPPSPDSLRQIEPLLYVAPYRTWAYLWLVAGLLAAIAAFFRSVGDDAFGFTALITPPALWALSNVITFIVGENRQGLLGSGLWLAVMVAVFIVAGWPEVRDDAGKHE